jgi:hypothetical protein
MTGILAFGHEVMVNDCLMLRQQALPKYRKPGQIFDFAGVAAYNAAGSIQLRPVFIDFVEFDAEIGTLFPIKSLNLPEPALTVLSLTQT